MNYYKLNVYVYNFISNNDFIPFSQDYSSLCLGRKRNNPLIERDKIYINQVFNINLNELR